VNAFGANEMGSRTPAGAQADPFLANDDQNSFRVRTGLLPGLFAFNVAAPPTEGLVLKARVGLYPQINNSGTRNSFNSQIDLREIFFTVDSKYGQVLLGRALNLYQGKNILTDMTLFGVGSQGPVSAGGTTLGRIGYGYLYSQFGAQARYTTPDLAGAKLAVALVDPSQIAGGAVAAKITKAPGVETELSYATKLGETGVQGWLGGLYQQASFAQDAAIRAGESVNAVGGSAGAGVSFSGVELLASGFVGKGLGSFFLLDTDAIDAAGRERSSKGFLLQGGYKFGATKVGLSYGQNTMVETAAEAAARAAPGALSGLESRKSVTAGAYHDLNANLKIVAEYTHAMADWFGGQSQGVDVIALGGFFLW
jgi:hypothetical protein